MENGEFRIEVAKRELAERQDRFFNHPAVRDRRMDTDSFVYRLRIETLFLVGREAGGVR